MKKILEILKTKWLVITSLTVALAIVIITSIQYVGFRNYQTVFVPGPGVTDTWKLSDFYDDIKGTIGDSNIYVLGSARKDEPSMLLLGGTHPNEPAGQVAATVLMENIEVNYGTVYIITETNRSAYTHSHPQEASVEYYNIETPFGHRRFKFGSRATNAIDQWPISDVYVHASSGQKLSGTETRNLNRAYPGNPNGTYTEKVAYAITEFIKEQEIRVTLDFHEASPEYLTNNAIVFHQNVAKTNIMTNTIDALQMYNMNDDRFGTIRDESSPLNLRGLSHRELGDNTRTLAFLSETSNASQGRIRGAFTESLIVDGYDKFYARANEIRGLLFADHSKGVPIDLRVGRHVQTTIALIESFNNYASAPTSPTSPDFDFHEYYKIGELNVNFNGLSFTNIMDQGVGAFLRNPEA